jgi:PAS domain S-box-containing protein
MAALTALRSVVDIESFIGEYYEAWHGTDEDRIMSYYAENVTVQIPGSLMQGRSAVREQFVRPFITGFPGNRHVVKNIIFGQDVAVVEFTFEAEHKGPFAGRAATDARVELSGCGVYEYDSARRQITAAHIYFDVATLLKQIIDQRDRRSRTEEAAAAPAGTIAAPLEHLDLATVIAVSQTVSGVMVLEELLETLMRTAVEHAGAERALLILSREAEQRIAAEAKAGNDTVTVHLCDEPATASLLPETVLRHVLRTRESVILDDAAILNPFSTDPYVAQRHARSIFCLPLTNQAKLIGVLYLENNLAPRVFAPARTAVLKLLASQAAISLENGGLYRELQARESKIRRLVDANIVGVVIANLDGQVIEANEAFLDMVGLTRDALASGRINWTELTPPEWQAASQRAVAQLRATGSADLFEKEYFRKDGSRVPALIAAAALEGNPMQAVAFVVDLTERKQAEAERERLRQLQADLARINRITTLGEMTASLAHEIRQPITAASTNGRACVRFLAREHPDVAEARVAAEEMVEDTYRAAEIINRVGSLYRKGTPQRQPVDANEVALETLALLRAEAERQGVSLRTELASDLPRVAADRVQLQQVFMNLMLNAIEAMQGTGGELCVRSERGRNDELLLSVSDTGAGLPVGEAEAIFDAFFTTKPQGTGMGLSISRSIIESHGGRLWASSGARRGATFHFSLPARGDSCSG